MNDVLIATNSTQNVFTPLELCDEIVTKLNVTNKNILVVENPEFVYSISTTDANLNTTYFVSSCALKCRVAKLIGLPPENIFCVSGVPTLEGVGGMKFDIVVGNPPYQKTSDVNTKNPKYLWPEFVELAINTLVNVGGAVALIHPKGWVTNMNQYNLITSLSLTDINIDECARHFKGVNSTFSYYVGINDTQQRTCTVVTPDTIITLETLPEFGLGVVDATAFSILEKMKVTPKFEMITSSGFNSSKFSTKCATVSKTQTATHNTQVLHSINNKGRVYFYSSHVDPNMTRPRVVASVWASKWSNMFTDDTNSTSQDFRHFPAPTMDQAKTLKTVLTSKLYTYVAMFHSTSNRLTNHAVSNFPAVDLTRTWTDKELYEHFNLTPEEVALIESTIK